MITETIEIYIIELINFVLIKLTTKWTQGAKKIQLQVIWVMFQFDRKINFMVHNKQK